MRTLVLILLFLCSILPAYGQGIEDQGSRFLRTGVIDKNEITNRWDSLLKVGQATDPIIASYENIEQAIGRDKPDSVLHLIEDHVSIYGEDGYSKLLKADIFRQMGQFDSACVYFDASYFYDPLNARIILEYASFLLENSKNQDAEEWINKAKSLDSENPSVLYLQGILEIRHNELVKSRKLIENYCSKDELNAAQCIYLAWEYSKMSFFTDANFYFNKAETLDSSSYELKLNRTFYYVQRGFLDKAEGALKDALNMDSTDVRTFYLASYFELRSGQFQAALSHMNRYLNFYYYDLDFLIHSGYFENELVAILRSYENSFQSHSDKENELFFNAYLQLMDAIDTSFIDAFQKYSTTDSSSCESVRFSFYLDVIANKPLDTMVVRIKYAETKCQTRDLIYCYAGFGDVLASIEPIKSKAFFDLAISGDSTYAYPRIRKDELRTIPEEITISKPLEASYILQLELAKMMSDTAASEDTVSALLGLAQLYDFQLEPDSVLQVLNHPKVIDMNHYKVYKLKALNHSRKGNFKDGKSNLKLYKKVSFYDEETSYYDFKYLCESYLPSKKLGQEQLLSEGVYYRNKHLNLTIENTSPGAYLDLIRFLYENDRLDEADSLLGVIASNSFHIHRFWLYRGLVKTKKYELKSAQISMKKALTMNANHDEHRLLYAFLLYCLKLDGQLDKFLERHPNLLNKSELFSLKLKAFILKETSVPRSLYFDFEKEHLNLTEYNSAFYKLKQELGL